jgi:hypothetical protein
VQADRLAQVVAGDSFAFNAEATRDCAGEAGGGLMIYNAAPEGS